MSDFEEYELVQLPKNTPSVLLVRDGKGVRISRYSNLNTDDLAIMAMFLSAWTQNALADKIHNQSVIRAGDIQ